MIYKSVDANNKFQTFGALICHLPQRENLMYTKQCIQIRINITLVNKKTAGVKCHVIKAHHLKKTLAIIIHSHSLNGGMKKHVSIVSLCLISISLSC